MQSNINNLNNTSNYFFSLKISLVIITIILSAILILFPEIDIYFSKKFYDEDLGFYLGKQPIIVFLYKTVPIFTKLLSSICLIGLIYKYFKVKDFFRVAKSPLMYLLITAILGPGIIVNHVFKDHFGRARPSQIREFNGTKEYTVPFVISDQCKKNCSFTSGHAAMAYYFTALSYIAPANFSLLLYSFGIIFGTIVGLARIAQGGHFLSDVFFSGLVVLLINHYLYKLYCYILRN